MPEDITGDVSDPDLSILKILALDPESVNPPNSTRTLNNLACWGALIMTSPARLLKEVGFSGAGNEPVP